MVFFSLSISKRTVPLFFKQSIIKQRREMALAKLPAPLHPHPQQSEERFDTLLLQTT